MPHRLPDDETLEKYLRLLRRVLVESRSRAYGTDSQLADLLDAVENIPDLLLRWDDMDEHIVRTDLQRVETSYPEWKNVFTKLL